MSLRIFKGAYKFYLFVTQQNGGLVACHNQSQTREAGASTKRKRFDSCAAQAGKMVDSSLKDHLVFMLKPLFLEGWRKAFYPIHFFLAFVLLRPFHSFF